METTCPVCQHLVRLWNEVGALLGYCDTCHAAVAVTHQPLAPDQAPVVPAPNVAPESAPEAPAPEAPVEAPAETPPATPAAVAHADETGVDLTTVEGTGSGGTITKSDVAAAAAAQDEPQG